MSFVYLSKASEHRRWCIGYKVCRIVRILAKWIDYFWRRYGDLVEHRLIESRVTLAPLHIFNDLLLSLLRVPLARH
jgi:hypothetical protein